MNGVKFDNLHSYTDLSLVLTSKSIPLPKAKTYIVEIPGADGSLDLSTALTDGDVKYENRPITMMFKVLMPWAQLEQHKSTLAKHLHGKIVKVIFDTDDGYYYSGRCQVTDFNTDQMPADIKISLDADPYKYEINETVITETVTDSKTITVPEQLMKVVPVINVTADMQLTHLGVIHQLYAGDNIIAKVVLSSGDNNSLAFTGTGTVTVKFRGGRF